LSNSNPRQRKQDDASLAASRLELVLPVVETIMEAAHEITAPVHADILQRHNRKQKKHRQEQMAEPTSHSPHDAYQPPQTASPGGK